MDTYRFRWKGCALQEIIQQVPPGVAVTLTNAMAKAWIDVTLDPGPPGSPAESDLNSIMLDMGWIPFSVNPTTPLRAVTTKQQILATLAADAQLIGVAPFVTLLSQAVTTDVGTLNVQASISGSTTSGANFRILLDGVQVGTGAAIGIGAGAATLIKREAVAAGAHLVELQWLIPAAGVADIAPVAQPDSQGATLFVEEVVS